MDLTKLSDDEFHQGSIKAGDNLNAAMLTTLNYLNENERRRYYSKHNCSSVHEYAVKFMKMDDSTASRHLIAARLLREVPELETRILSGTTPMTSVSEAGSFFRKEERLGKTFDLNEKKALLLEIDSQSTRKAKMILISKSAAPEIHFRERVTLKTEKISELTTYLDQETMEDLNRLKEIWSHAMPYANFADLIKKAVREAIESHDPVRKAARAQVRKEKVSKTSISAPRLNAQVKHFVWLRDSGKCTFVDPRTGECCESKHFVEEDHIVPKAMGGQYTVNNIRLRCRAHNQRHAIDTLGAEKMSQYLN